MQTQALSNHQTPINAPEPVFLNPLGGSGGPIKISEFFNMGRELTNHLPIDDLHVSGRHCRIEKSEKGLFLRDLRSSNGTFVNGAKIKESYLHEGDQIQVGESFFQIALAKKKNSNRHLASENSSFSGELKKIPTMAQSELAILIHGPSGSGKELIAKAVHQNSTRKMGPFISMNCGALNESLIESELFGHKKGSFTGADLDRVGAFETARGGTLFLDEIGDLPLNLQPKLLRALENQEIRAIGSDHSVKTDVRILTATHLDLKSLIECGKFRADLFYRINVLSFSTPSLVDRPEDFEGLLFNFAREQRVHFTHDAIQFLKNLSWPGNIRQLKNLVARARAIYPFEKINKKLVENIIDEDLIKQPVQQTRGQTYVIKEIEKKLILEALVVNKGHQKKTASQLGMPTSTLHDKIRSYGIQTQHI